MDPCACAGAGRPELAPPQHFTAAAGPAACVCCTNMDEAELCSRLREHARAALAGQWGAERVQLRSIERVTELAAQAADAAPWAANAAFLVCCAACTAPSAAVRACAAKCAAQLCARVAPTAVHAALHKRPDAGAAGQAIAAMAEREAAMAQLASTPGGGSALPENWLCCHGAVEMLVEDDDWAVRAAACGWLESSAPLWHGHAQCAELRAAAGRLARCALGDPHPRVRAAAVAVLLCLAHSAPRSAGTASCAAAPPALLDASTALMLLAGPTLTDTSLALRLLSAAQLVRADDAVGVAQHVAAMALDERIVTGLAEMQPAVALPLVRALLLPRSVAHARTRARSHVRVARRLRSTWAGCTQQQRLACAAFSMAPPLPRRSACSLPSWLELRRSRPRAPCCCPQRCLPCSRLRLGRAVRRTARRCHGGTPPSQCRQRKRVRCDPRTFWRRTWPPRLGVPRQRRLPTQALQQRRCGWAVAECTVCAGSAPLARPQAAVSQIEAEPRHAPSRAQLGDVEPLSALRDVATVAAFVAQWWMVLSPLVSETEVPSTEQLPSFAHNGWPQPVPLSVRDAPGLVCQALQELAALTWAASARLLFVHRLLERGGPAGGETLVLVRAACRARVHPLHVLTWAASPRWRAGRCATARWWGARCVARGRAACCRRPTRRWRR